MSVDVAGRYARGLIGMELDVPGDAEGALYRLEQRYGISPNQLIHLSKGRAKGCDISLFGRLKLAYLDSCERKLRKLQLEIEREKAAGDDLDTDLLDRANALLAEVAAKRGKVK